MAKASAIKRMPDHRRLGTLIAFVLNLEAIALDDALDLLDILITEIFADATRAGEKARLRTIKDLDEAAGRLGQVCALLLDPSVADSTLREAVFAVVKREDLEAALRQVERLVRPPEDMYYRELKESYRRVRTFLPSLLQTVRFGATPAGRPVLEALEFLRKPEEPEDRPHLGDPPLAIVTRAWRQYVFGDDERIDRNSLVLLAVVLEQPTELNPIEIMTDTGAYTDVVFGLFWLLGYRFSPRIADIGGARYWRMDPSADYGCLNGIARHRINTKLIAEHWDDLLRLAGSLKLGVVQATSVMRTLQIGDRPTKLAQAVAELGRIDKTIHALTYIDDEAKRRRILNQLNKGEDRHKLARAVFHGKQGELRQRYREGQEDQLGALGLVVNMIVLWNTLYINAALEQLAREGHHVKSEDVARLSPLVFEHINLLGRYAFSVPEAVTRGELRPLRNPAEVQEEVA